MTNLQPAVAAIQRWMEVFMRHSMHKFILYAKENNLSMSTMGALLFIKHKGACGVSDIGGELGISNAAASQMLDRMVQQKLIQRSEDTQDRRSKQIILIDKGQHILQESIRARLSWLDDLANTLSAAEQEQIIEALNLLSDKAAHIDTPLNPSFDGMR